MATVEFGFPGAFALPGSGLSGRLGDAATPLREVAKRRNVALDRMFYDVGNLTPEEYDYMVDVISPEGTILVVWPSGKKGPVGIKPFTGDDTLREAKGDVLQRFAIAGVGSSDLGAAAFARTLADHYREPVGAIIAGYGMVDLMSEALGGWFVLGTANRMMRAYHAIAGRDGPFQRPRSAPFGAGSARGPADRDAGLTTDSATLYRLLLDDFRTVRSVAGHSKGCLSIAFALARLAGNPDVPPTALDRARAMRVLTCGAVVDLPSGFDNVCQYLGALDGFGAMNSRLWLDHVLIPQAWHHLNTDLPLHMDLAGILACEPA